jgi:dihydroorotate dehydrogenase
MKLRGIDFGHVFNASGARGFSGEGYWFHSLVPGLNYKGSTFVAKTTTLEPRKGNMLLDIDHRPFDYFPDCIVVKMREGVALNSVGLSGPGILPLIDKWSKWLDAPTPYLISVMSVAPTPEERLEESRSLFASLQPWLNTGPRGRVGLQINFSCPNAGLDPNHLISEVSRVLDESEKLNVPTMIKLNALVSVDVAHLMSAHTGCDAIVMSNTIPWGQLDDRIDWKGLFGSDISPIAKYGGGGLSGKPLLPIVTDWIRAARVKGLAKPLIGGGGILSKEDADRMLDAGANAID